MNEIPPLLVMALQFQGPKNTRRSCRHVPEAPAPGTPGTPLSWPLQGAEEVQCPRGPGSHSLSLFETPAPPGSL